MPRKTLRRWLPDADKVRSYRSLRWMGSIIHDPDLFHLTRQSTCLAVMIGLFVAFLPIWGQMPLAALLALMLRANLIISVMLVWLTNPVTFPFFLIVTYKMGAWMLGTPPIDLQADITLEWLRNEASQIWKPLLLGSLVCGLLSGFAGYYAVYWLWRWKVVRNWEKRKQARISRLQATTHDAE